MTDTLAPPPCYCITGHGRSGTSFLTAMLQSAGLDVGHRLLGPHDLNPHGHFEDLDFLEFHVAVLTSQGFGNEGFILEPSIRVQEQFVGPARSLVEQRRRAGRPWGWKEPRSTLFLDFWRELVPELRFLLLFRRPWDVIDSLFRRGDAIYTRNPGFAVQVLQNYNRTILDFHDRFPDRCMLIESFAAAHEPNRLIDAIRAKFGGRFGPVGEVYEEKLFRHTTDSQQRSVLAHFHPETLALYDELRSRASLVRGEEERSSSLAGCGLDWALQYWVDFRRLEIQGREAARQSQAERERLVADAAGARAEAAGARAEVSLLHAEVAQLRADLDRARGQALQDRAHLALVRDETDELRAHLALVRDEADELRAHLALAHDEAGALRAHLARVESERDDSRGQLARAESDLEHAQARLAWVESSRFWTLRRLCIGLKSSFLALPRLARRPGLPSAWDRIDAGRPGIFSRFGTRFRGAIRAHPMRQGRASSPHR